MATRGSMPNAAAVSALHAAMLAKSVLPGATLTAQSPYTSTCNTRQQQQDRRAMSAETEPAAAAQAQMRIFVRGCDLLTCCFTANLICNCDVAHAAHA
jgi:hypothetical protein